MDAARRDRLLDLIDEQLVDPQPPVPEPPAPGPAGEPAPADAHASPEPFLDYLAYHHPGLPEHEVFRFRNPLLALHLRNRQGYRQRQARAERLLARLTAVLPPKTRGLAGLHLSVLEQVGDGPRRRALEGELFYWLDAAHARSAQRQLTADLRARRIAPEVVWASYEQNRQRWLVWRRLAWLGAYQDQPEGIPETIRLTFLDTLTNDLHDAGELRASLEIAEEALLIRRQTLPAGHPHIGTSLTNIAVALHALGRFKEALARSEEALSIWRQALPARHPHIASSLNNIGSVLGALGRHEEALARHEETLSIARQALPTGHPHIASSLNNIGSVLDALGRHEEALLIRHQALPAGHPDIATSLNHIAAVRDALGRSKQGG